MENTKKTSVQPFKPYLTLHEKIQICLQKQDYLDKVILNARQSRCANRVEIRELKNKALDVMKNIEHDHSYSQCVLQLPSSYYPSRNITPSRVQFDPEFEEFINEFLL
jgi:hypothetical protein